MLICNCLVINFESNVLMFMFPNNPLHFVQNKIIIHSFELDKFGARFGNNENQFGRN